LELFQKKAPEAVFTSCCQCNCRCNKKLKNNHMKKVLIVEDDPKMRKLLVDGFEEKGFKVSEAPNGQEGLKVAEEFKPDSIVLDLMMPIMDGLTMLTRLREKEWGHDVPVTILTNSDTSSRIAEALEKGVCKYMIKSDVSIEDIVKRISDELK